MSDISTRLDSQEINLNIWNKLLKLYRSRKIVILLLLFTKLNFQKLYEGIKTQVTLLLPSLTISNI